ncbi:MAG: UDP-N-acetylenolpyruvoylglucosamine reductase [Pseudomonadota bacterium]|jgi:UDP-N-acetylmuramate dehydrogenase
MIVQHNHPLNALNTFGISARAAQLVRIQSEDDVQAWLSDPLHRSAPSLILGGGSNIVLTGDVKSVVLKVEIMGRRLVSEDDKSWVVEAGAGESWHDWVEWTLSQGWPGLENMALIPGTVGAAPVQNIGAYGVELQDRFDSLDAMDLHTGERFTLRAEHCGFGYRDSVFKHASAPGPLDWGQSSGEIRPMGLAGRVLITRVRFRLPKVWRRDISYLDLSRKAEACGNLNPDAKTVFDWVCEIRRSKLPDPKVVGNAGSFFKNPTVSAEQCADIIARDPGVVHYVLADGRFKLAAGWLIDACGWRGKTLGHAGVYEKQALVLVNRGDAQHPCTGGEVITLAKAIQTSVYERFGIRLEMEPVLV